MDKVMVRARMSLGTQLSFALYGAANRMARMHKPFLTPLGLTFPQYLVMLSLLEVSPVSVGKLGDRLDMDTGTITPLLKRLDGAGIVTRQRDPSDERRVLVSLTPYGRSLENDIVGITGKIQSACDLDDESLGALRGLLEVLAHPAR
ncbi:MarR family transcriptional regulator [Sphingobium sp. CR2-8]|uniref:MarR family winged helix-turn-helix transcriptional regulator n=1 Tax=Sphingobium sp. CR2-8 TaxID=1306534 RepID=UPI002DB617A7|nr:MarR family transcriptional regulator [Sphingobium sp. CR2-8]MEC3909093.1 MarR family transcriptional regulator [Sphingobium sp. CR2-8]